MRRLWVLACIVCGCAPASVSGTYVGADAGLPDDTANLQVDVASASDASWSNDPRCATGYCQCCGLCQFAGAGKQCVAVTPADCLQSDGCKGNASWGGCMLLDAHCVEGPDDAACAGSSACKESAKYVFIKGHCAPGSQADCSGSGICKSAARCTFAQGECIPQTDADCQQSYLCSHNGECHFVDDGSSSSQGGASYTGRCRAATDADCKQSEVCLKYKWCTKSKSGICAKSPG